MSEYPPAVHLPLTPSEWTRDQPTEPVLEVRNLEVSFTPRDRPAINAVQGVSFSVGRGERFGLVGESGCGKSTTMLAIMGLLPSAVAVSGEVLIAGAPIGATERQARRRRWRDVAMVFQSAMSSLNPVRSVGAQIVEPMLVHRQRKPAEARQRAASLLELVGIPAARARSFPHELSGGMRQRAAIAMALACEPKLLIADEPTTALDSMVQAGIFDLLCQLTDDLGIALLLVTHDLPAVMQLCGRAAVMYAGRIVEIADAERLYTAAGHPYTRRLLAATPDVRVHRRIQPIPGTPPRLDRPSSECSFRARCADAFDRCGARPPLIDIAPGHAAACWLGER